MEAREAFWSYCGKIGLLAEEVVYALDIPFDPDADTLTPDNVAQFRGTMAQAKERLDSFASQRQPA